MIISILTCLQQVVRCNYTSLERKALVELTSYVKGVGTMMERVDTVVADSIWEVLHAQVQEFVQNKLAIMLRTTFKKKKDLSRYIIAPTIWQLFLFILNITMSRENARIGFSEHAHGSGQIFLVTIGV